MDINIRLLGFTECWELFKIEDDDSEEYKDISEKVKKGIKIRFSIFDYLKSRRSILIKDKLRKVIIYGSMVKLDDFDDEICEREKLMKKWLIEKLENDPIASVRGSKK